MVLYGSMWFFMRFYMILHCFYMILFDVHIILHGFHMMLHGFAMVFNMVPCNFFWFYSDPIPPYRNRESIMDDI